MLTSGYVSDDTIDAGLPSDMGALPSSMAPVPLEPTNKTSFEMLYAAMSAQRMPEAIAPRMEARKLNEMYLAWEFGKQIEINSAFMASRYYHSKQWTDEEVRLLKKRKQPITTKNRIKRKVDFLVGVEQRLRRDPKCYPRNPSADGAAYVGTACLRYVQDDNKWPSLASECASDGLIRGAGVLWQGVKLVRGRPEVRKHVVPSERFFYDPRSQKWDFSDARYLGEHQWLDMEEAVELLPFAEEMIESLAKSGSNGSFNALPQEFAKELHGWADWVDSSRRRIRLVSIWYKHRRRWMFDYLVGPVSLCPEGMNCVSPYQGEDEETDHPYRAWSPYIDESGDRYGVVRDMIPIQDEINKRTSKLLYQLTVRQTMGVAGAVVDIGTMKEEMAKPDGHVEYNPVGDSNNPSFSVIDQSQQLQGQFELLQEAKAEIENLGPNPGLIGRGVESQSGRAILAQQNSGMTELSPVFERLREWKLQCYRKDWMLMQQFWSGERYVRVADDPKAIQHLHINAVAEDPMTGAIYQENVIAEMDVDVLLEEGPDTITMREEIVEAIGDRPDVPLELIIELSSLPDKERLLNRLKEMKAMPPEVAELQKRLADLESALKAGQVDKVSADADKVRADTMKIWSDIMTPKPAPASAGSRLGPDGKPMSPAAPPQVSPAELANGLMFGKQAQTALFPVHYQEPSATDLNAMAGMQAEAQGQMGPPPNAMMAEGGMPAPEMGQPMPQNPMAAGEPPAPGQPGALPLGPGVG